MTVKNLDEYRILRQKKSHLLWRVLTLVFTKCRIPEDMRHKLMFVDQDTYTAWSEGKMFSHHHMEIALKYTRLYRALTSICGDDAAVSHWLFTENNAALYKGRSPLQSMIEGGEHTLDSALELVEYMAYGR